MRIDNLSQLFEQTLDCLSHHILITKIRPNVEILERAKFFLTLIPCDDLRKKVEAVITYAAKLPQVGEAGEKRKPVQLRFY